MIKIIYILIGLILLVSCEHTSTNNNHWEEILSKGGPIIKRVLNNKSQYEIQLLHTSISHPADDELRFINHAYNIDTTQYFYPASTVKMPVAFLALEYINALSKSDPDINMFSRLAFDSIAPPQQVEYIDTTSPTGYPNVAHYIEKIFSASDNNAYNRLYELLGQDYINDKLREKGIFTNSKIIHRVGVSGFDKEANKYTNPYQIIDDNGQVLYEQNELYALYDHYPIVHNCKKGLGYYDDNLDTIVHKSFDFSHKNFINLVDLQESMLRILYPEAFEQEQRFDLSSEQHTFLQKTMKKTPDQYPHLAYNNDYYDSYVKFFMYGDSKESIPDHIEISNKVGWAYGYLTDCAHIRDTQNDIEFFLTATIHVNANQIYNDGNYEYEEIGVPFLAELGRLVYDYELSNIDDSN